MEKVTRLDYVDVCKWLGISLVIFGHMKMPGEVLQWIYAFHMPLFFVLSGYTYRAQRIDKEFLMKKNQDYICAVFAVCTDILPRRDEQLGLYSIWQS